MKKFFLILLVAALMGSFAFAEVTGVAAPSVSGSVTTTFGFNLDNEATGFVNDSSVDVVVPLAGGSDTKMGSGAAYAEITIEDIEISFSTDLDDPLEDQVNYDASVSAKIVAGNLWVGLGKPDFSFNAVDQDDTSDANMIDLLDNGISVGFMNDMLSLSFLVASKDDGYLAGGADGAVAEGTTFWNSNTEEDASGADTPNTENVYAFGVNASVTAGPVTMPVWFAYQADLAMGFGAAPSLMVGPATIDIPVDYLDVDADGTALEINPAVSVALDGVGTVSANLFYAMYDTTAIAWDEEINAGVGFVEGFDDALTMSVDFGLTDLTEVQGDLGWEVDVASSYDMGAVAPYLNFGYDVDGVFDLNIGAVFATMIDMATVTLDYASDDVADFDNNKGIVTLAVSVSY